MKDMSEMRPAADREEFVAAVAIDWKAANKAAAWLSVSNVRGVEEDDEEDEECDEAASFFDRCD